MGLDNLTNNLSDSAKQALFNAVRSAVAEQGPGGVLNPVNGFAVGSSGNTLNQILTSTLTLSPAQVGASTISPQTFNIPLSLATTDVIIVNRKSSATEPGIGGVRVSNASQIEITYVNTSGIAQTPATQLYQILAIH